MRVAAAVFLAVSMVGLSRSTASAQKATTQWDGIYTEIQAKRGEVLYGSVCAACHNLDLTGTELAPALSQAALSKAWNNRSVGALLEYMQRQMPLNSPNGLSRQQNADILAFILLKADVPRGHTELPTEAGTLNQIKFVAARP